MNWISTIIRKVVPLVVEFFVGKRPTAEYLRKYPFAKTMICCMSMMLVCYLYTLDYAFATANELRSKIDEVKKVEARVEAANHQIKDYRMIIADQKARYLKHGHLEPFYVCDPNAGEDTLGGCIR